MPEKKYDEAWKKRLHETLEETKGNQSKAAKIMGVSQPTLRQVIAGDPSLKVRWVDGKVNNQTMHRKAQPMSDVVALQKENKLMAQGLEAMGITGVAKAESMAFLGFGQASLGSVRQLIGGGVVKLFIDLMADIGQIRGELADGCSDGRDKTLREDKSCLVKHVLDAYDRANKAAMADAIIKQKLEERKRGPRSAPAFSPITAIQINEPKEVNVATDKVKGA